MELLIVQGADVNAKTKKRQTPLLWARDSGNESIAELLEQHGANN